jgi:hypothetical protein
VLSDVFEQEVFEYGGPLSDIVSDMDVRLQREFWKTVHDRLGIKLHGFVSSYPCQRLHTLRVTGRRNSAERANGILEDTLRHFVGPCQTHWDEYLEFAMNNAWNQSIQNTPLMSILINILILQVVAQRGSL